MILLKSALAIQEKRNSPFEGVAQNNQVDRGSYLNYYIKVMGSLRDQLLKAKVISKKKLKKVNHSQRLERKAKGRGKLREERIEKEQKEHQKMMEKREADRIRSLELQQVEKGSSKSINPQIVIRKALSADTLSNTGGNRKFFFIDRRGFIPFVETNDNTIRLLGSGKCAIVEAPSESPLGSHKIVRTETARMINSVDPKAVLFLRGQH